MKKRTAALGLALALCVSLFPMTTRAAEGVKVTEIAHEKYDLETLDDMWQNGELIVVSVKTDSSPQSFLYGCIDRKGQEIIPCV